MSKVAFITGITGQDGAYLAQLLLEKGYTVHGGVRRIGVIGTGRLDDLGITRDLALHDFELLEMSNIMRTIDKIAPDEIYNLAAQSFVGVSFEQPIYTGNADALGTLRILEAIRSRGAPTRFYQASTSEMFGKVQQTPQNEQTPFYPRSPYGVAKLFAHWSTVNYRESFGLHASSGILFNHESPLRGKEFVTRKITLGMARIFGGEEPGPLELGNLDASRDWGFAGDYVKGMWLMMQQAQPGDYVLASGITHSIRTFIERVVERFGTNIEWSGSGLDEVGRDRRTGRDLVRINPEFYRPAEVDTLLGDSSKAERELGWTREYDLDRLIDDMVEADRKRISKGTLPY